MQSVTVANNTTMCSGHLPLTAEAKADLLRVGFFLRLWRWRAHVVVGHGGGRGGVRVVLVSTDTAEVGEVVVSLS